MTDREDLIEEAAKAIFRTRYPESRPDLADIAWESARDMPEGVDIRDEASAALAVFEKALGEATVTPTDDERAITVCIDIASTVYGDYDDAQGALSDIHMMLAPIAADFRRPEVPEPSAEDAEVTLTTEAVEANREYIERTAEPQGEPSDQHTFDADACVTRECNCVQGEPSDAQVEAANVAYWDHVEATGGNGDAMRAALRSARDAK